MKVLVIGSGGREHALALKISQSPFVTQVFCAPGNAGTLRFATNVDIAAKDIIGLLAFAKQEKIDLTVVGPEDPLTLGIVDLFENEGLTIFGPRKNAAFLEASKAFTHEIADKYEIPMAKYGTFTDPAAALAYLETVEAPVVLKADGLAAGKGVVICLSIDEAKKEVHEYMEKSKFGAAGEKIVIEEFLPGEEASCIAFVDLNRNVLVLEYSQDHKKVGDGDTGSNTGGMGAYSPAPVVTKNVAKKAEEMLQRVVDGMAAEGRPYCGVIYLGLMIDGEDVKLLEINVRFGDPETQPLMVRMKSDIVPLILATVNGTLDEHEIEWDSRKAVCITMAAKGYPGSKYERGFRISGILEAEETGAVVYHGGTALNADGELISVGGRVIYPTALGDTFSDAQKNTYRAVEKIESGGNLFFRKDIANRAINR